MSISASHIAATDTMCAHTRIISACENDTADAARLLAASCADDAIILLNGDLGAGKSLFARAFMNALRGVNDEEISGESPTFSLVNQYHTARGAVTHFDLYRLDAPDEVMHIGLEDALSDPGILLIEWPELARPLLQYAGELTEIHIYSNEDSEESARTITITPALPYRQ